MRKEEIIKKAVDCWFVTHNAMTREDFEFFHKLSGVITDETHVVQTGVVEVEPGTIVTPTTQKHTRRFMRKPHEAFDGFKKKYNVYIRRAWLDKIVELLKVGGTPKTAKYLMANTGLKSHVVLATVDHLRNAGKIKRSFRGVKGTSYTWVG